MEITCHTILVKTNAMAEIETSRSEKTKRFIKKSTRVDLTPMVDLGFLLLTFFVFTTTMSTQIVMKLNMPVDRDSINDPVCQSCVLTVLLDNNNSIRYYEGALENNPVIKETGYAPEEIRAVLMNKMYKVESIRGKKRPLFLLLNHQPPAALKTLLI